MLTWITEKELQREIKKGELFLEKQHENFLFFILFYSFLFFMRNVSGQQGAARKVKRNAGGKKKKKKAKRNTSTKNKIFGEHSHTKCVTGKC